MAQHLQRFSEEFSQRYGMTFPDAPDGTYRFRLETALRARYRVYYRTSYMEAHHPGDEVWCLDGDSIAVDASDQVTILRVEPAQAGDVQ